MARSKTSQSKHNTTVKKLAEQYQGKGYKSKTDIKGWESGCDEINGVGVDGVNALALYVLEILVRQFEPGSES